MVCDRLFISVLVGKKKQNALTTQIYNHLKKAKDLTKIHRANDHNSPKTFRKNKECVDESFLRIILKYRPVILDAKYGFSSLENKHRYIPDTKYIVYRLYSQCNGS